MPIARAHKNAPHATSGYHHANSRVRDVRGSSDSTFSKESDRDAGRPQMHMQHVKPMILHGTCRDANDRVS